MTGADLAAAIALAAWAIGVIIGFVTAAALGWAVLICGPGAIAGYRLRPPLERAVIAVIRGRHDPHA